LVFSNGKPETHADFTYSLSGNVISIIDLNLGNRSLTNDVETFCVKSSIFIKPRSSDFK
jgi:hypothetical protein